MRETRVVDRAEPLPTTQARLEPRVRALTAKWLLISLLAGGTGITAKETGALDALAAKVIGTGAAADPRVPALAAAVDANAKETKTVKRLVRWLVNQEIRRQEREGGRVAEPPEDLE
jgi:hypothetical protein